MGCVCGVGMGGGSDGGRDQSQICYSVGRRGGEGGSDGGGTKARFVIMESLYLNTEFLK